MNTRKLRALCIALLLYAMVFAPLKAQHSISLSAGPELNLMHDEFDIDFFNSYRTIYVPRVGYQIAAQYGYYQNHIQWLLGLEYRHTHAFLGESETGEQPFYHTVETKLNEIDVLGTLRWGNLDKPTFLFGSVSQLIGVHGPLHQTYGSLTNNDTYHPQYRFLQERLPYIGPVLATTVGLGMGTHVQQQVLRLEAYSQLGYAWPLHFRIALGLRLTLDLVLHSAR